jgi:hypothetical protein
MDYSKLETQICLSILRSSDYTGTFLCHRIEMGGTNHYRFAKLEELNDSDFKHYLSTLN